MLPYENATVVGYTLWASSTPIELVVRPLVAMRGLRELCRQSEEFQPKLERLADGVVVRLLEELPCLVIHHTAEWVDEAPCWYKHLAYVKEDGGLEEEDLWSFGTLRFLLKPLEVCTLVASTGRMGRGDYPFHRRRIENTQSVFAQTVQPPGSGPLASRLVWTSEQFVARKSPLSPEAFLLSGFPTKTIGGRHALVALPGLAIATHRFDLARSVLVTMASEMKDGLLPVHWNEADGSAVYESADTSLWFFWAVWHYWKESDDLAFVSKRLLDPMQEILGRYLKGTRFHIRMDDDGLLSLEERQIPLTWMDARWPSQDAKAEGGAKPVLGARRSKKSSEGPAVVQRVGKPLEVNALWYCALMVMAEIASELGLRQADHCMRLGKLVGQNFVRTFYNRRDGALFDCVGPNGPDPSIRPNMAIALGLPFSPLSRLQGRRILETVEKHLLTPFGLRTLSPSDPNYRGRCEGSERDRLAALHQGTVWAWLIGFYVAAVLRIHGLTSATQARLACQLKQALHLLEEGRLGLLGDLFDGDPPHTPRAGGCQVWTVGQTLLAIWEARLGGV